MNDNIFFPIAIKIAAKTISQDLVAVHPMSSPLENDYNNYKKKQLRKIRKEKFKKLFE